MLVGPPGAGKTTVGRLLADRLGVPFRDTDADVEATAGKTISDLFVQDGEEHFRALERAAVAATLLGGFGEGLAVVLAVKGLGRYAELRAPAAAERFIIGTLASALWAAACVGVAVLLRT